MGQVARQLLELEPHVPSGGTRHGGLFHPEPAQAIGERIGLGPENVVTYRDLTGEPEETLAIPGCAPPAPGAAPESLLRSRRRGPASAAIRFLAVFS